MLGRNPSTFARSCRSFWVEVMCTSALTWLWGLGLRGWDASGHCCGFRSMALVYRGSSFSLPQEVPECLSNLSTTLKSYGALRCLPSGHLVVAESSSFSGGAGVLSQLEGMKIVNLSNAFAQTMMKTFATRFPWDWAADIGEIPPGDLGLSRRLQTENWELRLFTTRVASYLQEQKHQAAVVDSRGEILASAADERQSSGGNETHASVMLALGRAGSAANLRESVVFFMASCLNHSKPPGAVLGSQGKSRVSSGQDSLYRAR